MGKQKQFRGCVLVLLLAACLPTSSALGQTLLAVTDESARPPLLVQDLLNAERTERDFARPGSTPRLRLVSMPAGFLTDPFGMEDDDAEILAKDPKAAALLKKDDDVKNVQLVLGYDNPYFDPLRPGSVGGVGYYKVYSQVQLLDTGLTSMCVNLQAYTPAGMQWGGVANGPTVLCPALSWFQDLGRGTALQGFVSENIQAGAGWDDNWNRRLYYGMAWHCPVPRLDTTKDKNLFFFVQTMGNFRYQVDHDPRPAMNVLPGIQWRLSDSCWMSLGGSRHGLFTCSWQF